MQQIRLADARAFNPERDFVWLFPRLARRALVDAFGETGTTEEMMTRLRSLMREHGVAIPEPLYNDCVLEDTFGAFVEQTARTVRRIADAKNPQEESIEPLSQLFNTLKFRPFVLLFGRALTKRVFCELPYWIEQIRTTSRKDPRPSIEEVESAVDTLLARL